MARAPTICAQPGCPEDATDDGRCAVHQRKAFRKRTPSSVASSDPASRKERAIARRRAAGHCEDCGKRSRALQFHHPTPVSQQGDPGQPGRMLCTICHRDADRAAGINR